MLFRSRFAYLERCTDKSAALRREAALKKLTKAQNILGYLENHYADDITLNELAEHKYFVSVGHLSRTFKNKTGQTFSKYLTELRLKKAKEFLINTDFDITDIATFTGYNDASYFTQIFRKSCGMTPSEYRSM